MMEHGKVEGILRSFVTEQELPDQSLVEQLNRDGVAQLMVGDTDRALEIFIQAFRASGNADELRAQCLINIGDWLRRVPGDLEQALDLFAWAESLHPTLVTMGRLRAMQAMVHIYPTQRGQTDPAGLERNITLLFEAVDIARQAQAEDVAAATKAESFALHRLAGTVCEYGSDEQKQQLLTAIEAFLPRLDSSSAETARLNYSKALIIAWQRPQEAIALLVSGAERMKDESPLDAGPYLGHAAEIALASGDRQHARELYEQAERFREKLGAHSNSGPALARLDRLKQELSE